MYGNPHSASLSSQLSTNRVEDIRLRVLRFFNANPDHFDLIFAANATSGIKLIVEGFREHEGGFEYFYHRDSHTSLVGVREAAKVGGYCFESDTEVESWLDRKDAETSSRNKASLKLFAYPAQSNLNGRRLPLSWASRLRSRPGGSLAYCLLDAAALVSTSVLDLGDATIAPDYVVLSFNKIFGFPDLGALIVRKGADGPLRKRSYFGGGTVDMVTCGKEHWHIKKQGPLHEQLEDGTLPIHSIVALDKAMSVHQRLYGTQTNIALHTQRLAKFLYDELWQLRHYNGRLVCDFHTNAPLCYTNIQMQGPILAFNIRNSRGDYISNAEVEKLANIKKIHIRSGGLCNPGGIASSLGLASWELKRNFSAGHICGDDDDILTRKPTGMLRVSLGAMSNIKDITSLLGFIREFFVDAAPIESAECPVTAPQGEYCVESLTIYPIKSCAGWQIPTGIGWEVRAEGLAWDREWCLVHQGTRKALSQKKYPKMALLRPHIDLEQGLLRVRYHGSSSTPMDKEIFVPLSADPSVYNAISDSSSALKSQVCDDKVLMRTYKSARTGDFLTAALGTPCTLARFPPASSGTSLRYAKPHLHRAGVANSLLLSNESPILVISRSSLNRLNEQIKLTDGKAAPAAVFRANIVIAEDASTPWGQEYPYAEDEWQSLAIGEFMTLDILGGCRRCQMVCIDQLTAEKNEEPFVTLAKTRRKQSKVFFGVHSALSPGNIGRPVKIYVGDTVRPSKTASVPH